MLTSSFVPGVSELFHYFGSQLAASCAPTDTAPPALSWRYGQMRRWHETQAFLFAENATPPIHWRSIAGHAARVEDANDGRYDGRYTHPRNLEDAA